MGKYEVKNIVILHNAQKYRPGDLIELPEPVPEGLAEFLTLIESTPDSVGEKGNAKKAKKAAEIEGPNEDESTTGDVQ